jgi:hydroxyacylglutathione hydrolase
VAHHPDLEHALAPRSHRRQRPDQGVGRKRRRDLCITGPAAEAARIPSLDRTVAEGDRVQIGAIEAVVMEVPAHTAGHIAYHLPSEELIFVGDTLFAMGCGRLFEGSADQMFANMQRLAALPPETQVYCAHEYTLSNGRYALVVEPDNAAVRERMEQVELARAAGAATVPTSIGLELATNPFMRAASAAELASRRQAKDQFRG